MKRVSVVTPCFNEAENVAEVYRRVQAVFRDHVEIVYEHLFIDNASSDATVAILKQIAGGDRNVKIIVNSRNFGQIRSPFHGLLQARGDAVILLVADLQDPPELIDDFLRHWKEGAKIVIGVKPASEESALMYALRRCYYALLSRIADIQLIDQFTGFGLYDRSVVEILRGFGDPHPYLRGMIAEVGMDVVSIPYVQPRRVRGVSKSNAYTLYEWAMLGITSHSRVPIRLAILAGSAVALLSFLIGMVYLVLKLLFWNSFALGTAPILIGLFFLASVQILFIGIIGEYVGAIHTQVVHRPLVIEKERVNFD